MKNLNDLYTRNLGKVRRTADGGIDLKDFQEARVATWADKEFRDARQDAHAALVGGMSFGRRGPRVGSGSYPGTNAVPRGPQGSGACDPRSTDAAICGFSSNPACQDEDPCKADLLGFTTLGNANFPLVGVLTPLATAVLSVTPRSTTVYKPAYMFVEARDASDDFTAIPGLITNVLINEIPQIRSSGASGALATAAFSVDTPLDVRKFLAFGSNNNNELNLTFGNMIAGTQAHFFGILWGDSLGCG